MMYQNASLESGRPGALKRSIARGCRPTLPTACVKPKCKLPEVRYRCWGCTRRATGTRRAITIGAMLYEIEFTEGLSSRGDAMYGLLDPEKLKMAIDSSQPLQRQVLTVLHESLHAIDTQSALDLDETQVKVLAFQLMQLLRSNPGLIKEMLEVLKDGNDA